MAITLKEKIQKDFIDAFKNKQEIRSAVLKMVQAEIKNREIEKRAKLAKEDPDLYGDELNEKSILNDEETTEAIVKEAKKRKDAIEIYDREGRKEAAGRERRELEILNVYLPKQMDEEKIRELAKDAIEKSGAGSPQDMGKVMGVLMPQVKGKADGTLVSKVVKELLG